MRLLEWIVNEFNSLIKSQYINKQYGDCWSSALTVEKVKSAKQFCENMSAVIKGHEKDEYSKMIDLVLKEVKTEIKKLEDIRKPFHKDRATYDGLLEVCKVLSNEMRVIAPYVIGVNIVDRSELEGAFDASPMQAFKSLLIHQYFDFRLDVNRAKVSHNCFDGYSRMITSDVVEESYRSLILGKLKLLNYDDTYHPSHHLLTLMQSTAHTDQKIRDKYNIKYSFTEQLTVGISTLEKALTRSAISSELSIKDRPLPLLPIKPKNEPVVSSPSNNDKSKDQCFSSKERGPRFIF